MPVKPAKTTLSREEIHEIIRANVRLFGKDPGFPDYITNLSLFLIDQAYCLTGERPSELVELALRHDETSGADDPDLEPFEIASLTPRTPRRFDPVFRKPPVEKGEAASAPPAPEPLEQSQTEGLKEAIRATREARQAARSKSIRPLPSAAARTPDPTPITGMEMEPPLIDPGSNVTGRAKLYNVVRSSGDAIALPTQCPTCGEPLRNQITCPSCGFKLPGAK